MFLLYRRSPTPADWITGQLTMDYRSSDSLSDRFSSRWSRVRNLIVYHLFLLSGKWYPTKKWLPRTSVLTCAIYSQFSRFQTSIPVPPRFVAREARDAFPGSIATHLKSFPRSDRRTKGPLDL